jgi:hypothetical protein
LNGYHATVEVGVSYNADTQKLKIENLPRFPFNVTEGVRSGNTYELYYTELVIDNTDIIPHEHDYSETPSIIGGQSYYRSYYKIILMDAITAQRISGGFRVNYTFTFPKEVVRQSRRVCASAWFTNCANDLHGNIVTYRVYNVIDGQEY